MTCLLYHCIPLLWNNAEVLHDIRHITIFADSFVCFLNVLIGVIKRHSPALILYCVLKIQMCFTSHFVFHSTLILSILSKVYTLSPHVKQLPRREMQIKSTIVAAASVCCTATWRRYTSSRADPEGVDRGSLCAWQLLQSSQMRRPIRNGQIYFCRSPSLGVINHSGNY